MRRRAYFLPAAIAALAIGAAGPSIGASPAEQPVLTGTPHEWTSFRFHPDNNAVLPGAAVIASWRVETDGAFSSSPSLADGVLYIGNNAGALYAIDAASGRVRWVYRARNPIMSAPIVYGGSVIVGEGNENSPVGSSPSRPIHVGSGEGALIALDRGSGRQRWSIPLSGSGMPTAAVVRGIIVHHDGAGEVVGVMPNGRVLYRRSIGSMASMVSALPVGDGFVTAGENPNALWRLRARDGSTVWKHAFPRDASGVGDCPPASDGRRLYCDDIMPAQPGTQIATGSPATQDVYAVDLRTGRLAWESVLETGILPERNEAAIPLVAGGRLFVGSSVAPWMHAFDAKTGRLLWRTPVRGAVKGGIVDDDGTIYFGDLGGYLWALDARTGAVIGDAKMDASFNVGSPIVAGGTLFVGSLGGSVLAVPLRTIRTSHD